MGRVAGGAIHRRKGQVWDRGQEFLAGALRFRDAVPDNVALRNSLI